MRPFFQSAAMKDSAGGRGLRRDVGAARGDCLLGGPSPSAPRGAREPGRDDGGGCGCRERDGPRGDEVERDAIAELT